MSRSFQAYGRPVYCFGTATVGDWHIRPSHEERRQGDKEQGPAVGLGYNALYIDWLIISLVPPGIFQTP